MILQSLSAALHKKRAAVVAQLKHLTAETEDITAIFEESEVISKIQTTRYDRRCLTDLPTINDPI